MNDPERIEEGLALNRALVPTASSPTVSTEGFDHGERFTPGPWLIEAGANSHFFDGRSVAGTECIAFVDGDIIESNDGDDPTIEPSANALLIAAAPDLYAVTRDALEMLYGDDFTPAKLYSLGAAMEAALLKAGGQQR